MREGIKHYGWKQRIKAMLCVLTLSCWPPATGKERVLRGGVVLPQFWDAAPIFTSLLPSTSSARISGADTMEKFSRNGFSPAGWRKWEARAAEHQQKQWAPVERRPVTYAAWFLLSPYPGGLLNLMRAKSG